MVIFQAIHGLLVPTKKKSQRVNGKTTYKKYTISDSQQTFLLVANSIIEANQIMDLRAAEKKRNNEKIQPTVIVIMEDREPKEFYVYFDDIKYKMFTLIAAIDCCFKCFHVFDLKYPLECINIWQFIQNYYFKLTHEEDDVIIVNSQLIKSLDEYSDEGDTQ